MAKTPAHIAVSFNMCCMYDKSTSLDCLSCCQQDVGLMNNLSTDIAKSYVSAPHVQCE